MLNGVDEKKIYITITMLLVYPVHIWVVLTLWLFLIAPGGISGGTQTLWYLENKYHEEFSIGDSIASGYLGGPIEYYKRAKPKSNPEVEFTAIKEPFDAYLLFEVYSETAGPWRSGYEAYQQKVYISQGNTISGESTPTDDAKEKARKELELAKKIRIDIAKDYLVPPIVVINENFVAEDNYQNKSRAIVYIYNFSSKTIPISNEQHKNNIKSAIHVLQNAFTSSQLIYATDNTKCEINKIDEIAAFDEKVDACF